MVREPGHEGRTASTGLPGAFHLGTRHAMRTPRAHAEAPGDVSAKLCSWGPSCQSASTAKHATEQEFKTSPTSGRLTATTGADESRASRCARSASRTKSQSPATVTRPVGGDNHTCCQLSSILAPTPRGGRHAHPSVRAPKRLSQGPTVSKQRSQTLDPGLRSRS